MYNLFLILLLVSFYSALIIRTIKQKKLNNHLLSTIKENDQKLAELLNKNTQLWKSIFGYLNDYLQKNDKLKNQYQFSHEDIIFKSINKLLREKEQPKKIEVEINIKNNIKKYSSIWARYENYEDRYGIIGTMFYKSERNIFESKYKNVS